MAMKMFVAAGIAVAGIGLAAQSRHRITRVSDDGGGRRTRRQRQPQRLSAGANIVRGVIKPGDPMEFASVKVDFKVTPAFKPGPLPKPVLQDASGKTYNTAQSFAEVGTTPSFSCTFSFRVPTGTQLKRIALDTVSIDLPAATK